MRAKTCKTCGGDDFTVPETRMSGVRVPAVECAYCHMLDLDEATACSRNDLDSARMAIAACVPFVAEASRWNDEPDTLAEGRSVGSGR